MPMRFPHLQAARVKLQERKNACFKSNYDSATGYLTTFLDFVDTNPIIRTITESLSRISEEKFADMNALVNANHRCLIVPADEIDRAAYHLRLLRLFVHPEDQFPYYSMIFGKGSNNFQDMADDFFSQVLGPFCSFIDERIDDGDLMLYTLARYQRECNWFESDSLSTLAQSTASRKLEEVMDAHLRSWLFREGIDFPFSTPKSPSGRPDVVVWEGEEPLAIEIKVYDGENRISRNITQGLWQAYRYASDYGKPFGYLVVFNTSEDVLAFANNVASSGPPCVIVGGLQVFVITIEVGTRRDSASKEKPRKTITIDVPTG